MDDLLEKWHDQFGMEDEEKSALVSEQLHEKTNNVVLEQVRHKTRSWLEAGKFVFRK